MNRIKLFSKILILLCSGTFFLSKAQVGIGVSPTAYAILDFQPESDKGISLPKINNTDLNSISVPGTLFFDTADSKVKVVSENDGASMVFIDLSVKDVDASDMFDLTEHGYNNYKEVDNQKGTVIGTESTAPVGVLVLESSSSAMVLPTVNSYTDIPSPEPGMIAYDKTRKNFIVYNGDVWTFWGTN